MGPAFPAKFGSRGKIQLRCFQGRRASLLSQRHKVAPLISATRPCEITCWRIILNRPKQREPEGVRELAGKGLNLNLNDELWGKRTLRAPRASRSGKPRVAYAA